MSGYGQTAPLHTVTSVGAESAFPTPANLTAARAVSSAIYDTMIADGSTWTYTASDISSLVVSGVFGIAIGTTADTTGASGGWVRQTGTLFVEGQSFFIDQSPYPRIHRISDRIFVDGAKENDGSKNPSLTIVGQSGDNGAASKYIDRSASFASYSSRAGVGIAGATRGSDHYANGYEGGAVTAWAAGASVSLGELIGYYGRVYLVTGAGALDAATPPSHQSGSALNGSATLEFQDYIYFVPIGVAGFAIQDNPDIRTPAWAGYFEAVIKPGSNGGAAFGHEIAIKNQGINVVPTPFSGNGGAIGTLYAGGGDASLGAPTNPSAAPIVVIANGHTWNKGIVFKDDALTRNSGIGIAIEMSRNHSIDWWLGASGLGARLISSISTANRKTTQDFTDNGVVWRNDNDLTGFRIARVSGALTGNLYVQPSTSASVDIGAEGSATDVAINIRSKGAARINLYGGSFKAAIITNTGLEIPAGSQISFDSVQVISSRKTGWTVATGTATRTAFDTATVTVEQLAQRVKALIDDLHSTAGHGLIGA